MREEGGVHDGEAFFIRKIEDTSLYEKSCWIGAVGGDRSHHSLLLKIDYGKISVVEHAYNHRVFRELSNAS